MLVGARRVNRLPYVAEFPVCPKAPRTLRMLNGPPARPPNSARLTATLARGKAKSWFGSPLRLDLSSRIPAVR